MIYLAYAATETLIYGDRCIYQRRFPPFAHFDLFIRAIMKTTPTLRLISNYHDIATFGTFYHGLHGLAGWRWL